MRETISASLLAIIASLALAAPTAAQTTGTVVGRVYNAASNEPLAGADVRITPGNFRITTASDGRFVVAAVPVGEVSLRVELIGYQAVVQRVQVRGTRATELRVAMNAAPVQLQGITVQAERERLIEPEVNASHEVIQGREVRDLPIDRIDQAVELATGVSEGHFRGGRVGQEVYLVDGLEVKNHLEASTQGAGIELSPSSVQELEVVTGGFGAAYGSALSGVVSYVTRSGSTERWEGRASLTSDQMMPSDYFRGFTSLSLSGGGPLNLLGKGTTLFMDVLGQGMLDADPRARGLTCLKSTDADSSIAGQIHSLESNAAASALLCPYTGSSLPHQAGDKAIGFARLDRPITANLKLSSTLLLNRFQHELYEPVFKYNPLYQLGQTSTAALGTLTLDWSHNAAGRAYHLTARSGASLLNRYLGVVDPASTSSRTEIGGFGVTRFRYLGEDFVRRPIDQQLIDRSAVPGYIQPTSSDGSPFGPAAANIFVTNGTPDLANWSHSESVNGEVVGELFTSEGNAIRAGTAARLYKVESYERARAYFAGSAPNYARFFPATASTFVETQLGAGSDVTIQIGARLEAFRSGLQFREDRQNVLAPVVDTHWRFGVLPRIGASIGVPGTHNRTAMRFNYGRVAQPPDFRYFLDTTIGDSLRTDIRRQGNPNLSFEKGASYEAGVSHLLRSQLSVGFTAFRKDLENLVQSGVALSSTEASAFNTGDFGHVQGVEVSVRGRWRSLSARGGYALQKALGVTSSPLAQPGQPTTDARIEYPLAFDRRHSADLAVFYGRAAGDTTSRWSVAAIGSLQSGYPLDLHLQGSGVTASIKPVYLPWTSTLDLRFARDLVRIPGCARCELRIVADGRNVLGRNNVVALRRDSGMLGPTISSLRSVINNAPEPTGPIPSESPRYNQLVDLNKDGTITLDEYRLARVAAALDRFDPSLYFGEARQVRLGAEISF